MHTSTRTNCCVCVFECTPHLRQLCSDAYCLNLHLGAVRVADVLDERCQSAGRAQLGFKRLVPAPQPAAATAGEEHDSKIATATTPGVETQKQQQQPPAAAATVGAAAKDLEQNHLHLGITIAAVARKQD